MSGNSRINAAVIVLGDLGRSPRMLYHARSLADHGADVDLIGYSGSALPRDVLDHRRIRCHAMEPRPLRFLDRFKGPLNSGVGLLRVALQTMKLFVVLLLRIRSPDVILLQNPPGVPALAAALVCAPLRRARVIVDWHNFGFSILALKSPKSRVAVSITRWCEWTLGRRAHGHLCVSDGMRRELEERWGFSGIEVFYDCPAASFMPPRGEERPVLRLQTEKMLALSNGFAREKGRALLVSATSWTPDEDFGLLLDALSMVDRGIIEREREGKNFPALTVVISGEGPLRKFYEEKIARIELQQVEIRTVWLAPEDYPLLLRGADLGLCLHRSSSGFDLPMKLADMLGSGLPVLALDYGPCLTERLRPGENGLLFSTAEELARLILGLFSDFPDGGLELGRLRENVAAAPVRRWDEEWLARAWPAISQAARPAKPAG